jgi:hypothetical protein
VSGVYVSPLPRFALVLHCLQVSQSTSSPNLESHLFSSVLLTYRADRTHCSRSCEGR